MSEKIVAKFGGTSLADAGQVRKVAAIVNGDPRRRFIVVSAPGKRDKDDQKITDLLLTCWHLAQQKLHYREPLGLIETRYQEIAADLGVAFIDEPMAELTRELEKLAADDPATLATRDWVAARGEYFHSCIVAEFLEAVFVPAGECIRFDAEGRLDPVSYTLLAERMADENKRYVIPGFYGRDVDGRIKTFSRGGSDVTGAVAARAVGALVYENWTDVPGMLMADPRVVENPPPIAEVTYRELRELAYMGATVLHEEVIFPVWEADIPIHVKNTNAPDAPGTCIVRGRAESPHPVVGIAGRTGFTAITIEKWRMNQEVGFGHKALGVLLAHNISFEHVPSAIDALSLVISDEQLEGRLDTVVSELTRVLEPGKIETYPGLALIATVGEGMAQRVGVSGTVFSALRDANVNVRMISQGASEISILIGVAASDYERAVRALYQALAPPREPETDE